MGDGGRERAGYRAALATVDRIVDDILVDTGTTIPGLLAAGLSSSSDSTTSGAITRTCGNTWTINATIGAITGYTSPVVYGQAQTDDTDSDASCRSNSKHAAVMSDLLYVNGATASDSTQGRNHRERRYDRRDYHRRGRNDHADLPPGWPVLRHPKC